MKAKTIQATIRNKIADWLDSITDEKLRLLLEKNIFRKRSK